MKEKSFKSSERSEEQARSRTEDLRWLENDEVSAAGLRRENTYVKSGGFTANPPHNQTNQMSQTLS